MLDLYAHVVIHFSACHLRGSLLQENNKWDVYTLKFFSDIDCNESSILNEGTPFSSGSRSVTSSGTNGDTRAQNAFDDDIGTHWDGGGSDPFIGLEWNTDKVVKCVAFNDGDLNRSRKVSIEGYDGESWHNIKTFHNGKWQIVQTFVVPKRIVLPPSVPPTNPSTGEIYSSRWRIVNMDSALL